MGALVEPLDMGCVLVVNDAARRVNIALHALRGSIPGGKDRNHSRSPNRPQFLDLQPPGVSKCDYENDKENENEYGRLKGSRYFTDKAHVCDSCVATRVTW